MKYENVTLMIDLDYRLKKAFKGAAYSAGIDMSKVLRRAIVAFLATQGIKEADIYRE